jgi:hypothetical protein
LAARVHSFGQVSPHHQSGMARDRQAPTMRANAAGESCVGLDRRA